MTDRITLIQADVCRNMLAFVEMDDACCACSVPCEDDGVLVLHRLKSHLDSEIRRDACGHAMRVGFVKHVVLGFVFRFRLPLGVVRDLSAGHSGFGIDDSHIGLAAVDVRLRGCHPIAAEIRLAVRRSDNRSGWSRRSTAPTCAPSRTAWAAWTLPGGTAAALGWRLADQHLGKDQHHRKTYHDG